MRRITGPPMRRTIGASGHDDELSSRDRSDRQSTPQKKEIPMSSSMVSSMAIIVRRSGPTV